MQNAKETVKTWTEEITVAGNELKKTVEALLKDATVHRLVIRNSEGKTVVEIPAIVGVAGGLLLLPYALIATGIAVLANYKIEIVRSTSTDNAPDAPVEITVEDVVAEEADNLATTEISEEDWDDLTAIKGIGPKYAAILNEAGIVTYSQLAAMDADGLRQILTDAGINRLASPESWAEQANLLVTE